MEGLRFPHHRWKRQAGFPHEAGCPHGYGHMEITFSYLVSSLPNEYGLIGGQSVLTLISVADIVERKDLR